MTQTRRRFLSTSVATAGTLTLLPYSAPAAETASDTFATPGGDITVHPISNASLVLETPLGTIFVDPVGDPAQYSAFAAPDLILITHEHPANYNDETMAAVARDSTQIITNPAVYAMLPGDLKSRASGVENEATVMFGPMRIEAIPAYNTTEDRLQYHPEGRDNGYVLNFDKYRVYVSGDSEDTPEMRALDDIDLAFVCMNMPFTMDANAAASAVSEFAPTFVYPYHYRGADGEMEDPESFARMVGSEVEVKFAEWYR